MKDWILNLLVDLILKAITDDKIEDLAHKVQAFLLPYLKEQKDAVILKLQAKAAATNTKLDDAAVHALDVFLSSFIPKPEQCFIPKAGSKIPA